MLLSETCDLGSVEYKVYFFLSVQAPLLTLYLQPTSKLINLSCHSHAVARATATATLAFILARTAL